MNVKSILLSLWPIPVFLLLSVLLFLPEFQGKTLQRGDTIQGEAKIQGIRHYQENKKPAYIWNPGQFAGMPILYGAPSRTNLLLYVDRIMRLGTERPVNIYFLGFLCSFLLGRLAFKFDNLTSILLSVLTILPLTNLILWKAGHTSKIEVLVYTPMIILGVIYLFERRKYLLGGVIFSYGMGMSLFARHPQMTYYIFMIFLIYGIVKLVQLARKQIELKHLMIGVGMIVIASALSLGTSASKIWTMQVHSEQSLRGKKVLSKVVTNAEGEGSGNKGGLDWDYAMTWSNDWTDLVATIIPGFNGGSSGEPVSTKSESFKNLRIERAPLYWGALPFTESPMYVGILAFFLFVWGANYVKGHFKWWLVSGVVLTYMISMGKNLEWFNHFIFDTFPYYNKFRTPQSILSVTPYFMTILGVMGIHKFIKEGMTPDFNKSFYIAAGSLGALCLAGILVFPNMMSFEAASDARYAQQGIDVSVFFKDRQSMMSRDSIRSLIILLASAAAMYLFAIKRIKAPIMIGVLVLLGLFDNIMVNNRYLSFDDYVSERRINSHYELRPVDEQILSLEKDRHAYRVQDLSINTYNSALGSYYHNTIGGYDPVKLRRYQDLLEVYITKNHMPVLNMLNTKYFIGRGQDGQGERMQLNPDALGNAWFINNVMTVTTPDDEFAALQTINTAESAAICTKDFADALELESKQYSTNGSITVTDYNPDNITYQSNNTGDGFAVFSEVWFDGKSWDVSIDGKKVPYYRVNYLLRGLEIPAGNHQIEFKFRPESFFMGEKISLASSGILLLLIFGLLAYEFKNNREGLLSSVVADSGSTTATVTEDVSKSTAEKAKTIKKKTKKKKK
jgi:hypothetical protein